MSKSNIPSNEWKDLETELKSHGRKLDDFEFVEDVKQVFGTGTQPIAQMTGTQPIKGTVKVKNKKTGQTKTYHTGHGSKWVAEISRDLKAKAL